MDVSDSLPLVETPCVLDVLMGLSEASAHPLLEDDMCLWVGENALGRVIERSDQLPSFPILEPADLWSTSGIAIYERGTPLVGDPEVVTPEVVTPEERQMWTAAHQWWASPAGLVLVEYYAMTLDYLLIGKGAVKELRRPVRLNNPHGFDHVEWESDGSSEWNAIREDPKLRFATPGNRPVLIAAPFSPFVWEWGLRCEPTDDDLSDWKDPREGVPAELAQRGDPDMARAARALKGPRLLVQHKTALHYARFWTLMQAAAAPAEHLPRQVRRSLDRSSRKAPKSRPRMGNLWVVDLPRPKPETTVMPEPAGNGRKHSYRYPVRGHWREQWYPSVQSHKPIWIDEHVRGPDSAPFHDYRPEWEREHPVYRLRVKPPPPRAQSDHNGERSGLLWRIRNRVRQRSTRKARAS